MTGLDWAALSRLVPEIALVAIFVWFTLERDRRASSNAESNHKEWRSFLDIQRNDFLTAIREDNAVYREGMARIAEEVKAATGLIRDTNALLLQHDQQAREFIHRQEKK